MSLRLAAGALAVATLPVAGVNWSWSAPRGAAEAFEHASVRLPTDTAESRFVLTTHVNPAVLFGDFDGDSRTDVACLVRERKTGKVGIAVAMQAGAVHVIGAGSELGNGGDDFAWIDRWFTYTKAPVERGASEGDPPTLRGDAIHVEKTEAASALIYFEGGAFEWYQQGD